MLKLILTLVTTLNTQPKEAGTVHSSSFQLSKPAQVELHARPTVSPKVKRGCRQGQVKSCHYQVKR